jgi:hypothetical protein
VPFKFQRKIIFQCDRVAAHRDKMMRIPWFGLIYQVCLLNEHIFTVLLPLTCECRMGTAELENASVVQCKNIAL